MTYIKNECKIVWIWKKRDFYGESKNGRGKIFTVIMFVITALYIAFIWIHSTVNAEESTVESTSVLKFLSKIFVNIGLNVELTDFIIRKSAHFCEFALLGCLCIWTAYRINRKIIKNLLQVGFVCLAVATIDEIIQIYSPGRSSQVSDVLLDFCGAAAGVIFFILVWFIIRLFKKVK